MSNIYKYIYIIIYAYITSYNMNDVCCIHTCICILKSLSFRLNCMTNGQRIREWNNLSSFVTAQLSVKQKEEFFFVFYCCYFCYFKNYFIFYCVLYISDPDHHSCGIKIIKKINPCDNLKFSLKQYQ